MDNLNINQAGASYLITASGGANGDISPNGSVSVFSGANQTFNINANACYQIADVLVDGVSQGIVGTYTFTNVRLRIRSVGCVTIFFSNSSSFSRYNSVLT